MCLQSAEGNFQLMQAREDRPVIAPPDALRE
jgi:hypothetical protein